MEKEINNDSPNVDNKLNSIINNLNALDKKLIKVDKKFNTYAVLFVILIISIWSLIQVSLTTFTTH